MNQYQAILEHIPPALLVVFRIGGLMIYGPVFGAPVIPIRIKVALGFLIGIAVYPLLAVECFIGADLQLDLWSLAPLLGLELLIGFLIGYISSIPLIAVQTGGLMMGQQMGLGFARFYNPSMGGQADVVGQLLFFMVLSGFLLIGGHEAVVMAILRSFQYIPVGEFVMDLDVVSLLAGVLLASLELALRIATPVLALVFLQSTAMGFMAKTVPQLNILSLGFPIRILIGLTMIMFSLVVINEVMMEGIDVVLDQIFDWVESY